MKNNGKNNIQSGSIYAPADVPRGSSSKETETNLISGKIFLSKAGWKGILVILVTVLAVYFLAKWVLR